MSFYQSPFRRIDQRALVLALMFSAASLSLVLSISSGLSQIQNRDTNIALFPAKVIASDPNEEPIPEVEPEVARVTVANSGGRAAHAEAVGLSSAPAPQVPVVREAPINLSQLELPEVEATGATNLPLDGNGADGDRVEGNPGAAGDGGVGTGDGQGAGAGSGNKWTASWAPSMDFNRLNALYPSQAKGTGIEGKAWLRCRVLSRERVRNCTLVAEEPANLGFGQAALRSERIMRIRLNDETGRRIYNRWVVIETVFESAEIVEAAEEKED